MFAPWYLKGKADCGGCSAGGVRVLVKLKRLAMWFGVDIHTAVDTGTYSSHPWERTASPCAESMASCRASR